MIPARWFVLFGLILAFMGLFVGLSRELALATRVGSLLVSMVPEAPPTPLQLSRDPSVREVVYLVPTGHTVVADLYEPQTHSPGPALILMPGVMRNVRAYAPLVKVASAFARAGFVVLVPEGLDYDNYRLLPEDVNAIVTGFQWLAQQPSVDPARIGFVGLSVGGSLCLVAAADPRIADDVAVVATVGAYGDLDLVLQAVTTGYVRSAGGLNPYVPDPLAWLVVRNTLIGGVESESDKKDLLKVFPVASPLPDQVALEQLDLERLTPSGRAVFDLFVNRDPDQVLGLVSRLRETLPGVLETISPIFHSDGLRAPVMLLHDRGDSYVPSAESMRLSRALGSRIPTELTMLDVLKHVEISAPNLSPATLVSSYIPGMWELFMFTYGTLIRI